jgi:hypothetical protein
MEMEERVRQGRLAYHDPGFKERLGIQDEDERHRVPIAEDRTTQSPREPWAVYPPQAYAADKSPAGGAGAR